MPSTSDDRWQQAYNNAAEELFGKVEGDVLTEDEDTACIAAADAQIADEDDASYLAEGPYPGVAQ